VATVCGSTFINVTVCGAPCEKAGADSAIARDATPASMMDRRIEETSLRGYPTRGRQFAGNGTKETAGDTGAAGT
jgi:hypothetical protein